MGATADKKPPRPVTVKVQTSKIAVRPQPFRVALQYGEGAEFKFENDTPFDIDVDFLRDDLVRDAHGQYVRRLPVDHGSPSDPLTVNLDLPNGIYPYQVLVQLGVALSPGFEASGGSRPEIEIRK